MSTATLTPRQAWEARLLLEQRESQGKRLGAARRTYEQAREQFGGEIFRVPTHLLPGLERELARLQRRATRLGVKGITCVPVDATITQEQVGGVQVCRPFTYLAVSGQPPRLQDWLFLGVLDRSRSTRLRLLPGARDFGVDLRPWQEADIECEHCRLQRRRNDTFLVGHQVSQVVLQVGSSCLRDFTGHEDPMGLARYAEGISRLSDRLRSLEADTEWETAGEALQQLLPLEEYLAFVAAQLRQGSWLPRSRAERGQATADRAGAAYWQAVAGEAELPSQEDRQTARDTLEWLQRLEERPAPTRFEQRLLAATQELWVRQSELGVVAAAVHGMLRDQQLAAEPASQHLGNPGERLELELQVVECWEREYPGPWGPELRTRYLLRDAAGNRLSWNSSSSPLEQGERVRLRGTVKEHRQDGRGRAETQLTRCRVLANL